MLRVTGWSLVFSLLLTLPALAQKEFGFDNRKPSGQPYLSPDETVKRMKVAPEFEVKLFAGEPLLANPIAFTIDERGRIWAVECFEYPSKTPKGKMPRDRIVILEDTDGDGKADKRTVFCEGKDFPESFDMASGIEVGHGGVFLGAPPFLWFIENKNDKPGKFEKLLSGFGSQDTHETLNTFQWGPDGWLYGLHGVFTQSTVKSLDGEETRMNAAVWRFHPRTRKFEIFAEGTSNPWGMDWRNTDGEFILACCVIPHLYHIVPGAIYKRQAGTSYNPYSYGFIPEICDHTFHRESGWAHAGLISLDTPIMPEKYRNSVIFGSIHGCSIKQNILKPSGSSFTASRGDDFLVSGDKNVRPINLRWGPNGDIYLIDWHDQNPCHQALPDSWDMERGRVYRIQLKGNTPKKAVDMGKWDAEKLRDAAKKPANPFEQRTALRLLQQTETKSKRSDGFELVDVMDEAIKQSNLPAFWQLFDIPVKKADEKNLKQVHESIKKLLLSHWDKYQEKSTDLPTFRGWAVRYMADSPDAELVANLTRLVEKEKSSHVRRELASAAVRLSAKENTSALIHALMARQEDAGDPLIPHLTWLAYEKLLSQQERVEPEFAWLAKNAGANAWLADYFVPRAIRRIVATGNPKDLARCVELIQKLPNLSAREKALEGLALAVNGLTVDAPPGWKNLRTDLLTKKSNTIVSLVNKIAVSFRDPEAVNRALAILIDPTKSTEARTEAVRQLSQLKAPQARLLFMQVLQKDPDEKVRAEATRGLSVFDDKNLPQELLDSWTNASPNVRSDIVMTLSSRKEWARLLLIALQNKKLDRRAVNDSAITRIQGFRDKELDRLIDSAWGKTRTTPADLAKLIDSTREKLSVGTASYDKGKKVFENQCAKCHKFEGQGSDVGPALEGAARDIEYLLANILDPNRVIGAPYFVRQINTLDGQLIQGVLAEEDDRAITLKIENGQLKKILKADIDGKVKVLEKSMMPEGLTSGMTEQDFRDLVRFVMLSPFPSKVKVDEKTLEIPVAGLIPLPTGAAKPVTITIEVTALADVKTVLLVGTADPFEVRIDGQKVGEGKGIVRRPNPDQESMPVSLSKGTHTVTITSQNKGAVSGLFARFADPDRKLRY